MYEAPTEAVLSTASPPYQVTIELVSGLQALGIMVVAVEHHHTSSSDLEPDFLWLSRDDSDSLCEGEYLSVTPVGSGRPEFEIELRSANRFGGHPTVWSEWLSPGDALVIDAILTAYFTD